MSLWESDPVVADTKSSPAWMSDPVEDIEHSDSALASAGKGFMRGAGQVVSNFGASEKASGLSQLIPKLDPEVSPEDAPRLFQEMNIYSDQDKAAAGFTPDMTPEQLADKFNTGIRARNQQSIDEFNKRNQDAKERRLSLKEKRDANPVNKYYRYDENLPTTQESGKRMVVAGDALMKAGNEFSQKWKADDYYQAKKFTENMVDEPVKTVLTAAAEQAPNLGVSLVAGLLTRGLGRVASAGAMGAMSYNMEGGDIFSDGSDFLQKKYGSLDKVPNQEWGKLLTLTEEHASFNAALDTLMPSNILESAPLKAMARQSLFGKIFSKEGLKHITKEGITDMALEVPTELAQEASSMAADEGVGQKFTPDQKLQRLAQVAVSSAGVGGGAGALKATTDIASAKTAEQHDAEAITNITSAPDIDTAIDVAMSSLDTATPDELQPEHELDQQLAALEPQEQPDVSPTTAPQNTDSLYKGVEPSQATPPAPAFAQGISEQIAGDPVVTEQDRRLDPKRAARGARRRLQMPDEYLEQRHREKVALTMSEDGLSQAQAEAVNKRFAPKVETDKTTGYYEKRNLEPSIERAQQHTQETGEPTFYAEVDMANMGGGNKHYGGSTVKFDREFYTPWAKMLREEVESTGGDVIPVRAGGDELGFIVANTTQEAMEAALNRASERTIKMAHERGMGDIKNPKYADSPERGINLYFGVTPIPQGKSPEQIREVADSKVGLNKSERNEYVGRIQAQAAGAAAPAEQAGGTESGVPASDRRIRPEGGSPEAGAGQTKTGVNGNQGLNEQRGSVSEKGTLGGAKPDNQSNFPGSAASSERAVQTVDGNGAARQRPAGNPAADAQSQVDEQRDTASAAKPGASNRGIGAETRADTRSAASSGAGADTNKSTAGQRNTRVEAPPARRAPDDLIADLESGTEQTPAKGVSSLRKPKGPPRFFTAKQASDRGYISSVSEIDEFNRLIKAMHAQGREFDGETISELREIVNKETPNEKQEKPKAADAEVSEVSAAAHEAATSPKNDLPEPTDAQKEAGNYKMGHVTINGLDISIENPAGSRRRPEWPPLKHHYGYIKGTVGKDKDHVDVFLTDDAANLAHPVYVVDQVNVDGKFDEHKVLIGFKDLESARAGYLANYSKGWKGLGSIRAMLWDEFKRWLDSGNTTKPLSKSGESQSLLDRHEDIIEKMRTGELPLDQYQQAFKDLVKNEAAIKAELNAKTKDELLKSGGMRVQRYKADKKEKIVEALFDDLVDDFMISTDGGLVSYSMSGLGNYRQQRLAAVTAKVEAITQENLDAYAARVKAARDEAAKNKAERVAGLQNPKTLADFQNLLRLKMADGMTFAAARMELTPDQREQYDLLAAEETRPKREADRRAKKTRVYTSGQKVDGNIIETKHTKKGHDLFVVQLAERVSKEDYEALNTSAKKMGGYYSSYRGQGAVPGFTFTERAQAEAFTKLAGGDTEQAQEVINQRRDAFEDNREQSAVERLREMADRLDERADEKLSQDRKQNTSRRAAMAARAEANANYDKAVAKSMRNLADAIEAGKAQFLDDVRTKAQIEMLNSFLTSAKYEELRAKYPEYSDQEKHKGEPPTKETADYAQWPAYSAYRSDLAKVGRQLSEIDGSKLLGQKLLKIADDVSKEYIKFAKDNFQKVAVFSTKSGERAVFSSKGDAEEAINRSGYNGTAVVLPYKPRQNVIILSPAEAQKRGIWEGADDQRLSLSPDLATEIIQKANRANRGRGRVEVPWQLESAHDRRTRLAAMGIETPAEFRAALREYVTLKEPPKAPDKVKELERSMIGRRKDGMDFFPTPEGIADEMVATAGIQEGMSVLEPSAGMGHIADRIREAGVEPDVIELSPERRALLEAKGYNVVGRDFLDSTEQYDRIIMNPPFSDRRDAEHIQHAYSLLKPGGRLVALAGEGVFFGSDKKANEFRDWLESVGASDEKLEEGVFQDPSLPVNTGANARMVVIDKPANEPKYSKESIVPDGKKQLGLSERFVRQVANDFLKGVDATVKITVQPTQKAAGGGNMKHTVKAVFHGDELILIAENFNTRDEIESTLRHEIFFHYGFSLFPAETRTAIEKRVNETRDDPKHADTWQHVLKNYDEASRSVQAQEFLAKLAETEKGRLTKLFHDIMALIQAAMRKLGWKGNITQSELQALLNTAERQARRGGQSGIMDPVYQKVFHGTPHKFDKFSLSAMGTGEGNQAYGWGLYFAGKKEIAEFYKRGISNNKLADQFLTELPEDAYIEDVEDFMSDEDVFNADQKRFMSELSKNDWLGFDYPAQAITAALKPDAAKHYEMTDELQSAIKNLGALYQAEIPEDSELLSWDKEMKDQPESVQKKLSEFDFGGDKVIAAWKKNGAWERVTGQNLYRHLADGLTYGSAAEGKHKQASMMLASIGIPGLRYLDNSSRGKGEGTHNYVIWDENAVTVEAVNDELRQAKQQSETRYSKTAPQRAVSVSWQTETPAFSKWFGDSKVVDESGKPLVVFHGTVGDFDNFEMERVGQEKYSDWGEGIYLTPSPSTADYYREEGAKRTDPEADAMWQRMQGLEKQAVWKNGSPTYPEEYHELLEKWRKRRSVAKDEAGSIMPLYASIKKPYIVEYRSTADPTIAQYAKERGHDGIFVLKPNGKIDEIIAFQPSQIKSAIGNRGTFSPDDPNILYSKTKAAPVTFKDWTLPDTMSGTFSSLMTKKDKLLTNLRQVRRKMQDKFIVWRDVQDQIGKSGGTLSDFSDAYNKFTLIEGKVGDQFKKLFDEHVEPIVKDLSMSGVSIEQLGEYLYAQFAPQRNKRIAEINPDLPDGGSGLTNQEAKDILSKFSAEETRQLERLAQKVYAMQKHKLQVLVDSGRLTAEVRDELLKDDRYVPLKGFADTSDLVTDTGAIGRGFDQAKAVFKMAKGRKTLAAEILSTSVRDVENAIINAEKNRVGQSILKLVMDNPNENLWKVNPIKIEKAFNKSSGQVEQRTISDYKALARDPNVFVTWVKGKPYAIEFRDNPMGESSLARAVKNMGVDNVPKWATYLSKLNRWLSTANTALSPEFLLTNPIRDIQTALAKTYGDYDAKIAGQVMKNLPKAIKGAIGGIGESSIAKKVGDMNPKWTDYYKEYAAEGGKTDYFRSKSVNEMRSELEAELAAAAKGKKGAAIRAFRGLTRTIENGNAILENTTRLSMYITLRENGYSKHKAATAAKNLTVNFNRRGEAGAFVNSLYLFYNASMQGTHLTLRMMRNPKVQKMMVVAGAGMIALTQYNILMGGDDDDGEANYFKIPDYEKERNVIIMWPDGSGRYTKFPMPYGLNVPMNAAAAIAHVANGQDPIKQALWLAGSAWNSFSPIGENGWNIIAPTVLDPFVDIALNRDYAGKQIMPEANPFDALPPPDSERSFSSTHPAYKAVAKFMNQVTGGNEQKPGWIDISPESIQHLVETYTGAAGGFLNRVVNYSSNPELFKTDTAHAPFIRKFYGETSPFTVGQNYRDNRANVLYFKERLDHLRESARGNPIYGAEVEQFRKENHEGLQLYMAVEGTEKQLSKLYKTRKAYEAAGKTDMVDKINERIREDQGRFNARYNAVFLDRGIEKELDWLKPEAE